MQQRRRPAVARLIGLLGIVAATLLVSLPLAPAAAAAAPAVAGASALSDATSATKEARLLRQETTAMLSRYLTEYGARFTTAENDRLRAYRAMADRQLATVVVTARRLEAAVTARAPRSEILAAGRAAQRSHQRARTAAQASYEGARQIMEPRLSLFEGIAAIRDYDAMLGRFDDLGERIDAVVATVD
jgi:hypothetical protein